jgi:hypothetical protein
MNDENTLCSDTGKDQTGEEISKTSNVPVPKPTIWQWWGKNDTKVVAIGTLLSAIATTLMAVLTFCSIDEAKMMRNETKKVADLAIQDFKIRAYPSFLLSKPLLTWKTDSFIESMTIHNKGEITAHNVTMLLVRRFIDSQNKILFEHEMGSIYKDDEAKTIFNFETKIFRDGYKTLESRSRIERNDARGRLSHQLLYVRFKIPFENAYFYEAFAFSLERDKSKLESDENAYFWQETDTEFRNKLIIGHLKSLRNSKEPMWGPIKSFLSDYPGESY